MRRLCVPSIAVVVCCLALAAASSIASAQVSADAADRPSALEAWPAVKDSADPDALDEFARAYPNSPLAVAASVRARLLRVTSGQVDETDQVDAGVQIDEEAPNATAAAPTEVETPSLAEEIAPPALVETFDAAAADRQDKALQEAAIAQADAVRREPLEPASDVGAAAAWAEQDRLTAPETSIAVSPENRATPNEETTAMRLASIDRVSTPDGAVGTSAPEVETATTEPTPERSTSDDASAAEEPAQVDAEAEEQARAEAEARAQAEAEALAARRFLRDVQRELNRLGYDLGGADGRWGPKSRASFEAYLSDAGRSVRSEPDDADLLALRSATPRSEGADDDESAEINAPARYRVRVAWRVSSNQMDDGGPARGRCEIPLERDAAVDGIRYRGDQDCGAARIAYDFTVDRTSGDVSGVAIVIAAPLDTEFALSGTLSTITGRFIRDTILFQTLSPL